MTAPRTIVSFHAHPDDEALLTGGFLAGAASAGHRVVLIVATDGAAGLSGPGVADLGAHRRRELHTAARHLGVARVVWLGYADSGSAPVDSATDRPLITGGGQAFAAADPDLAAARVARILDEERASLLTVYDASGGYGHPDHRQVHVVGHRAALLASTPDVVEATIDRTSIARGVRLLRLLAMILPMPALPRGEALFTARADITHRLDVRPYLPQKRAALRAHASQTTGGPRTISLLLRLPRWVSDRILGTEYFRATSGAPVDLQTYLDRPGYLDSDPRSRPPRSTPRAASRAG